MFAFGGETAGACCSTLALTKSLVIVAAALVTLTVAPACAPRSRCCAVACCRSWANPLTRGLVRLYRPFVSFALRRPVFTLLTALLVARLLPAHRVPARHRVFAAHRRRRPALHANDDAWAVARRCDARAGTARSGHRQSARGRAGVRQDWPRGDGYGSGAILHGRDHDPAEAARFLAEARAFALVFELGATPARTRARPTLARAHDGDTRGAGRELGSPDSISGLDQRVDSAGTRAHGHDVDRRQHASRHSDRGQQFGAARRVTRGLPFRAPYRASAARKAPFTSRLAASCAWLSSPMAPRSNATPWTQSWSARRRIS